MPAEEKGAYARAGVDIDAKMQALKLMTDAVRSTYGPEVLGGMGNFGGLFSVPLENVSIDILRDRHCCMPQVFAYDLHRNPRHYQRGCLGMP